METQKRIVVFLCCCVLLGVSSLRAQEKTRADEKSCVAFAQAFYDWYVAESLEILKDRKAMAPWHGALKARGTSFSISLSRALIESDVQAEADGDPVLDFDPILNSQDPADRYKVRSVTRKDDHYWAQVYGVWSRPIPDQGKGPQVVAEIAFVDGRWQFVNFHYPSFTDPNNESLPSILKYHYQAK